MKKNLFSLMELLTVILVVLTILSLLLPSVNRIYKNSNNLLCQKNLKDLHTLVTSYANDNGGILPGTSATDLPEVKYNDNYQNSNFYRYWNGHLVTYIDTDFSNDKWQRSVKLFKSGEWTDNSGVLADSKTSGYELVKDMLEGNSPFNVFLCPEVMNGDVFEPGIYLDSTNQTLVPKMFNLTSINSTGGGAFYGLNYSCSKGLPVCYAANNYLFQGGTGSSSKKKMSAVKDFGKKVMLIEGGNNLGYQIQNPYVNASDGDADESMLGFTMLDSNQFDYKLSFYNFVHDDEEGFWYSSQGIYMFGTYNAFNKDGFNQFNDLFTPTAYVAPNRGTQSFYQTSSSNIGALYLSGWAFVTHEDPSKTSVHLDAFKDIFKKDWNLSFNFISTDDIRTKSAVGNSNLLFGDGTVKTKNAGWIFTNRLELFSNY